MLIFSFSWHKKVFGIILISCVRPTAVLDFKPLRLADVNKAQSTIDHKNPPGTSEIPAFIFNSCMD